MGQSEAHIQTRLVSALVHEGNPKKRFIFLRLHGKASPLCVCVCVVGGAVPPGKLVTPWDQFFLFERYGTSFPFG